MSILPNIIPISSEPNTYLLPIANTARSLLSVPTGELVAYLRYLDGAYTDLTELVSLLVDGNHHLVNDARLRATHEHTAVSLREALGCALQLITRYLRIR